jgi:Ca-activated chloride channel family protein
VVLVSDGEHHGENLSGLIMNMQESGIRILLWGVGTTSGGKIPEGKGYKKDEKGEEVISRLNDETLFRTVAIFRQVFRY